jgi:hypothetical protein
MRRAVYNSGIPNAISKSVKRALLVTSRVRAAVQIFFILIVWAISAEGIDLSGPELQLARKIVAVTGPGAVALTVENRSSLARRENEAVQNGLRSALEGLGLRFVKEEEGAATVAITLSENLASYVWVAEIRQGAGEVSVVLVSAPRPEGSSVMHDSVPLSLRKIPLWTQADPILDVAVLEESTVPTHIAVLDPQKISFYRLQGGKWQQEFALGIAHTRPWPRDLRGRLMPAKDHLLDVYLPGVVCRSGLGAAISLNCRESDDPWPLTAFAPSAGAGSIFPSAGTIRLPDGPSAAAPQMNAFYAPARNFFTGALTPGIGKFTTVPKFYSAAPLPREKYALWLFAATDGQVHLVDGVSDQVTRLGWGSDLASVKTPCGAGWQVLATGSGDAADSVRAYEFPDRDPVAVSPALDFSSGDSVTALWTEGRGDTAIAVLRDRETGTYAAVRLALACNQ